MAFAQSAMGLPQGGSQTTPHVHSQKLCHEQGQADSNRAIHHSMSHVPDGKTTSSTQPDCCKSSHCQCHCVHTPALSNTLIPLAASIP